MRKIESGKRTGVRITFADRGPAVFVEAVYVENERHFGGGSGLRLSILLRKANPNLNVAKEPDRCPHCGSDKFIRYGKYGRTRHPTNGVNNTRRTRGFHSAHSAKSARSDRSNRTDCGAQSTRIAHAQSTRSAHAERIRSAHAQSIRSAHAQSRHGAQTTGSPRNAHRVRHTRRLCGGQSDNRKRAQVGPSANDRRSDGRMQRYRCKRCGRTFSSRTNGLGKGIRLIAQFHEFLAWFDTPVPVRVDAAYFQVSPTTIWRWRHRVLSYLVELGKAEPRVLDGKVMLFTRKFSGLRSRWSKETDWIWRRRGSPLPRETPLHSGDLTFVFAIRFDEMDSSIQAEADDENEIDRVGEWPGAGDGLGEGDGSRDREDRERNGGWGHRWDWAWSGHWTHALHGERDATDAWNEVDEREQRADQRGERGEREDRVERDERGERNDTDERNKRDGKPGDFHALPFFACVYAGPNTERMIGEILLPHLTSNARVYGIRDLVGRRTMVEDVTRARMAAFCERYEMHEVLGWYELYRMYAMDSPSEGLECVAWDKMGELDPDFGIDGEEFFIARHYAAKLHSLFVRWMVVFRAVRLHYIDKYLEWFYRLALLDSTGELPMHLPPATLFWWVSR